MSSSKQQPLTAFFGGGTKRGQPIQVLRKSTTKRLRNANGSHFGSCPLCQGSFPYHQLERHASSCNGKSSADAPTKKNPVKKDGVILSRSKPTVAKVSLLPRDNIPPTCEPIPGLFIYEEFITVEEERQILSELDGSDAASVGEFLPWKLANFNGPHLGKRWGVHCNLRDRMVEAAENPLPNFVKQILMPKLLSLQPMNGCVPNEANAIDYRREQGHHLSAHVDDRKLSKESIANLSLAGDCYMTFRNVAPNRNTAVTVKRVLLKRRCLQILTGKARYDFSHEIQDADLLSDRRVSVTMRESPLTKRTMDAATIINSNQKNGSASSLTSSQLWWKKASKPTKSTLSSSSVRWIPPVREPIPGLFVFPDFITAEEEAIILREVDDESLQPWAFQRHTGKNREKRWGIDHDLWSQSLRPPKHALPDFMHAILIPRLQRLKCMQGCTPNDVNAIEYRRAMGHSLGAHVDDRKKHKEPIANLSLAGDIYMTFANVQTNRNLAVNEERVLLPRRCLQVMTGKARYDFSHGIAHADLLSERRVSVTMRETPFPK